MDFGGKGWERGEVSNRRKKERNRGGVETAEKIKVKKRRENRIY